MLPSCRLYTYLLSIALTYCPCRSLSRLFGPHSQYLSVQMRSPVSLLCMPTVYSVRPRINVPPDPHSSSSRASSPLTCRQLLSSLTEDPPELNIFNTLPLRASTV